MEIKYCYDVWNLISQYKIIEKHTITLEILQLVKEMITHLDVYNIIPILKNNINQLQ